MQRCPPCWVHFLEEKVPAKSWWYTTWPTLRLLTGLEHHPPVFSHARSSAVLLCAVIFLPTPGPAPETEN